MTGYEANRYRIERNIRTQKRRGLMDEAAGDEERLLTDRVKLTRLNQEYRRYNKAMGFKSRAERLQQDWFGGRQAAQTGDVPRLKLAVTEKSSSAGLEGPNVDLDYINSDAYKAKFKNISDNPQLNQAIYKYSKAMLTHQSGDYYEDLTSLSLDGSLVGQTSGKVKYETRYSKRIKETVQAASPYSLVSIHNHGTNVPPSGADFGSAGEKRYAFGIVVCHNGKLYKYSAKNARPFAASIIDTKVDIYRKPPYDMSENDAFLRALNDAQKAYGIEWSEIT